MGADAVLSIVLYVVLYMTVIQLLGNTLTAGKIVIYTAICFISVIARLVIYRSAYYLCFARGAEMCGEMRLDLANHYRSLSLGYFNQNSSGYLPSCEKIRDTEKESHRKNDFDCLRVCQRKESF